MGIYTQPAGRHNLNRAEPNFTVVNKMMVNTRLVKLPNPSSLGRTPDFAKRDLGELRGDWIEILVDAGIPLSDPHPQNDEFAHFIV